MSQRYHEQVTFVRRRLPSGKTFLYHRPHGSRPMHAARACLSGMHRLPRDRPPGK